MYFEDVALGRAMRDAGYDLKAVLDVSAQHEEGASSTAQGKSLLYKRSLLRFWLSSGSRIERAVAKLILRSSKEMAG